MSHGHTPLHVVTVWLGNTSKVADKYDLQVPPACDALAVTQRDAVGRAPTVADPNLEMVINHWDDLSDEVRSSILLIARATCG
ncbi:MAG: hypothetical protein VX346_06595 [Planctomycetota bacterium]|nr:hypothetical protein [Planctomycetota bacterium]